MFYGLSLGSLILFFPLHTTDTGESCLVFPKPVWLAYCSYPEVQTMKVGTLSRVTAICMLAMAASGCSSWDSMSHRQKSTVTGAGIGGVAGAVLTGGRVLGTTGGAAIGGLIGDQIGKNNKHAGDRTSVVLGQSVTGRGRPGGGRRE